MRPAVIVLPHVTPDVFPCFLQIPVFGRTPLSWRKFLDAESARVRDRYLGAVRLPVGERHATTACLPASVRCGRAGGIRDCLSAPRASELLGPQDAEYPGTQAQARLRCREGARAGHLRGRASPPSRAEVFRLFRARWQRTYPARVERLGHDLLKLLTFFCFSRHLWKK
jgi:hypothetical protein